MKNYLIKTAILTLTLTVGVFVAWGFDLIPNAFVGANETPQMLELKEKHKGKKIAVLFKGFSVEGKEAIANFEVVNISNDSVKYWAFEEKGDLFHFVEFNGEELNEFWCGTGQKEFSLVPNDSIVMKKNASRMFQNKYMKDGKFRVNFGIGEHLEEPKQFWSEEFTIPKDIQKLIKEERGKIK